MCGICGSTSASVDLQSALKEMSHRGPDGMGTCTVKGVTFGHVLLAIQDPGNASQPMKSSSGKTYLTYNGEVYNHLELRSELPGFPWKTSSDSETILELLEKFGSQVASKFRGMYAIAFWDTQSGNLHLMRDYYGEKPLFYFIEKSGAIHFSSEVRNLALICEEKPQFSLQSISHYLKYLYFDPINSIYTGIESIPPGTELVVQGNVTRLKTIHETSPPLHAIDSSDLRKAVNIAVQRTLLSDVPIGVMLSGGIDSTIIASSASDMQPGISTFTLRRSLDDDDARFARIAAQKYGTNHHEIEIDKSTLHNDIYNVLAKASQPFADTSLIPTYLLSKYASEFVKVLISGDGADELFGGYTQYEMYRTAEIGNQTLPEHIYKYLKFKISRRTRSKNVWKYYFESNLAALESRRRTFKQQWDKDSEILSDRQIRRILQTKFSTNKHYESHLGHVDNLLGILDLDLKSYLPADILFKSDTAGMLASVEIRAPFLDLDVRNVRDALDPALLGNKKRALVDAFRSDLPPEIISRKKLGFGAPVDDWFSLPKVKNMAEDVIQDKSNGIYNFMNFREVQRAIGFGGNLVKWEILSLAIWVKENVK